jgi:hypothetical protein
VVRQTAIEQRDEGNIEIALRCMAQISPSPKPTYADDLY